MSWRCRARTGVPPEYAQVAYAHKRARLLEVRLRPAADERVDVTPLGPTKGLTIGNRLPMAGHTEGRACRKGFPSPGRNPCATLGLRDKCRARIFIRVVPRRLSS